MVVSILRMERTLIRKLGFSRSESHHHFYHLFDRDGNLVIITKLSHGAKGRDISKAILSKIARQMKLSNPQLQAAVDCPLSKENYSDILKEQGLISSDLP